MPFPFTTRPRRLTKAPRRCNNQRGISHGFECLEDRRMLATIPVTLATDAFNNSGADGGITLREAINYINGENVPDGDRDLNLFDPNDLGTDDTIIFSTDPADGLDGATIQLTAGELSITNSVTINASMLSGGLTIDAQENFRIFEITGGSTVNVTMNGLSLINGVADFEENGG